MDKILAGCLQSDPMSMELHYEIGARHQRSLNYEAAFASFDVVFSRALLMLERGTRWAGCSLASGEIRRAMEALRRAAEHAPDCPRFSLSLGSALLEAYRATEVTVVVSAEKYARWPETPHKT